MNNNLEVKTREKWENLHSKKRFQPKYPSEHVIRFMFTNFPEDIKERNKLNILDIGCGAGSNTVFLAKEGFSVYCTDISEAGLNITEKRLHENNLKAVIKNAGMESQPFEDNFFDGAISFGVFYYNTRDGYQKAVDELIRILKVGGHALVFSRTTDDYRFGKGKEIEKNTFILDIQDTNEGDMPSHFLSREDIDVIFSKFTEIVVEKTETTFSNLKNKNSDWIIKVKK